MAERWAKRCKANAESGERKPERQLVFGIGQGAVFEELRRSSAQALAAMDFDGYAIGGVSVGEPEPEMMQAVGWSEPHLPGGKPRYAMGVGPPPQPIELIARGVGMVACVLATRFGRAREG